MSEYCARRPVLLEKKRSHQDREKLFRQQLVNNIVHIKGLNLNWCLGGSDKSPKVVFLTITSQCRRLPRARCRWRCFPTCRTGNVCVYSSFFFMNSRQNDKFLGKLPFLGGFLVKFFLKGGLGSRLSGT